MLAWRGYVIWNRNSRSLILPISALVLGIIGGITVVVYDILICLHGTKPVYMRPYNAWTIALYSLTFVYNWVMTGLVVWRLRWADHGQRVSPCGPQAGAYTKVIIALVECGMLYSLSLVAFVIAFIISPVRPQSRQRFQDLLF